MYCWIIQVGSGALVLSRLDQEYSVGPCLRQKQVTSESSDALHAIAVGNNIPSCQSSSLRQMSVSHSTNESGSVFTEALQAEPGDRSTSPAASFNSGCWQGKTNLKQQRAVYTGFGERHFEEMRACCNLGLMATATVGSFTVVASTITEGVSPVSSTLGRPEHGKHFTHTRLQGLNIRSSLWYRQNVNKAQVASASSPLVQVSHRASNVFIVYTKYSPCGSTVLSRV